MQWISADLLIDLWRVMLRVDARPSFRGAPRIGLWESSTGLHFFHPPRAGDAAFYRALYGRLGRRRFPSAKRPRGEFALAAAHIRDGERVLDVGCGFGAFRHAIPQADYTGLDPHVEGEPDAEWFRGETLERHLESQAGAYDVVCGFQVLEHVEDPLGMLTQMSRAVRPGGRVIVAVPHVPSAHTRIPNYLIGCIPHHLTWWTREALGVAARKAGLVDPAVQRVPWTAVDGLVYWMARLSPIKCRNRHYRHAWSWHLSSAVSFLAGYAAWTLRPTPPDGADEGASLMLVAEKPA